MGRDSQFDTPKKLVDGGRVLNHTEQALVDYLGNERQAIAMAPHVNLIRDTVEQAVIKVLVNALEAANGIGAIEYLGGERRVA